MEENKLIPKAQVIICKCGSKFAACVEPECYTDTDWHKSVRDYTKKGCKVETIGAGLFTMEKCKCDELKEDKLQLKLFEL